MNHTLLQQRISASAPCMTARQADGKFVVAGGYNGDMWQGRVR